MNLLVIGIIQKPNLKYMTMEKQILSLLVILITMTLSCQKQVTTNCLQAKIIRVTCANTVIQVLNNNSVGEDGWLDTFNNNARYDNVFAASNACHIPSEYKVGDLVYITIDKSGPNDCIVCAMYDAPPKVSFHVKSIANLPCINEVPK